MADDLKVKVKFVIDSGSFSEIDDAIKKLNTGSSTRSRGGAASSTRTPKEEPFSDSVKDPYGRKIVQAAKFNERREREYQKSLERQTKSFGFLEKMTTAYRKSITGVLIDLHMLRVVGQQSKVVSSMFDVLAKSLGYVVDMVLIPAIPYMIKLGEIIRAWGTAFAHLPDATKRAIAAIILVVGGFIMLMNTVYSVVTAYVGLRTWIIAETVAHKSLALTINMLVVPALIALAAVIGSILIYRAAGKYGEKASKQVTQQYGSNTVLTKQHPEWVRSAAEVRGIFGFASGGPLRAGQAAVVGERGPELLLPSGSGFNVIPNNGLRFLAEGTNLLSAPAELINSITGGVTSGFGLIKGGADAISGFISNIFSKSIMGGGVESGVGTTVGDSQKAIMSKGLQANYIATTSGFKNANSLLAAILAALLNFGQPPGETPTPEPVEVPFPWTIGDPEFTEIPFPWKLALPVALTVAFPWRLAIPTPVTIPFPWNISIPRPQIIETPVLWTLKIVQQVVHATELFKVVGMPIVIAIKDLFTVNTAVPITVPVTEAVEVDTNVPVVVPVEESWYDQFKNTIYKVFSLLDYNDNKALWDSIGLVAGVSFGNIGAAAIEGLTSRFSLELPPIMETLGTKITQAFSVIFPSMGTNIIDQLKTYVVDPVDDSLSQYLQKIKDGLASGTVGAINLSTGGITPVGGSGGSPVTPPKIIHLTDITKEGLVTATFDNEKQVRYTTQQLVSMGRDAFLTDKLWDEANNPANYITQSTYNPVASSSNGGGYNPTLYNQTYVPGTGWSGSAEQWAYLDANYRQQLVNSGDTYTIAGVQYKNGNAVSSSGKTYYDSAGNYIGPAQDSGSSGIGVNTPSITFSKPTGDTSGTNQPMVDEYTNAVIQRRGAIDPSTGHRSFLGNLNPAHVLRVNGQWYWKTSSGGNYPITSLLPWNSAMPAFQHIWEGDPASAPGLARGGTILRSGLAMVGEYGPELLNLPRGAVVSPGVSKSNKPSESTPTIVINDPVFQFSGKDERAMFEEFMKLMERESRRVR